jgi:lysine-N-methylase
MSNNTTRMLAPQYVAKFKCIGSACEDTCCIGWQVPVDEATYKKYRACPDPGLLVTMTKSVTRNRTNPTPDHFAKINMPGDMVCPFLDAERLCSIQKKLGEEYLSVACTSFPRISSVVNDVVEQSLTLSCPEAARLALLDPAIMEFDELEVAAPGRLSIFRTGDTRLQPLEHPSRYLWELRIFTITVLQSRDYRLADRLILLGMFFRSAQQLVDAGNAAGIPELIAEYSVNIAHGAYRDSLDLLPAQNPVSAFLLTQILDPSLLPANVPARYLECLSEFSSGIGYAPDAPVGRFSEVCEKYYEPFMKGHEYILEHFLVNAVFKSLFPLSRDGLFEQYVKLAVLYALVRTYLIGISGLHREAFGVDHIIKLIQSFSKAIEHNEAYLKRLHAILMDTGSATMAHISLLINAGSSGNVSSPNRSPQ